MISARLESESCEENYFASPSYHSDAQFELLVPLKGMQS